MKAGFRRAFLLAAFVAAALVPVASANHDPAHKLQCATNPSDPSCQEASVPEPQEKKGSAKVIPQAPKSGDEAGIMDKIGEFFAAIGSGISDGAGAVGGAASAAFIGAGALVLGLVRPLAELLASLQPSWVGPNLYAGVTSAGVAGVAGGAQYGSYLAWKKYLPLGVGLPLFSRIEKDELLDNDRRARIFELIKTNPGIHLSEIARELDFAWGTTLHHLRKLRADRLIMFKSVGHHKSFFVNGSGLSEKMMEAMSLIKNGTLGKLANYLEEHPRVSLKELSEGLGISPPLAAFHVRKLEKAGLVQKVRDGKSVRLSTTQAVPAGFFRGIGPQEPAIPEPVGAAS